MSLLIYISISNSFQVFECLLRHTLALILVFYSRGFLMSALNSLNSWDDTEFSSDWTSPSAFPFLTGFVEPLHFMMNFSSSINSCLKETYHKYNIKPFIYTGFGIIYKSLGIVCKNIANDFPE
uniref:Uncharacterized protein n=1 Tax=Clastoptera arizonana TaxID=38151 RepID=A0A1B6DED0_9HEMI